MSKRRKYLDEVLRAAGCPERAVSAQVVDGVVLIGTEKRVLEWDPKTDRLRTLAHAEDRT
jgi:hypothetical protein